MAPSSLKLPLIGLGTRNPMTNVEELKAGLRAAFDAGYRFIDTAYIYYNESIIGEVLQEYYDSGKLRRADVFICSKLPCFAHNPKDAEEVLKESLHALRTDYIDLYLIHQPTPLKRGPSGAARDVDGRFIPDLVPHIVTWTFMEKFHKRGVLRFIGLSNFNRDQIEDICRKAEIMPHHLQVELHMLHRQKDLVLFCRKKNISLTAYSPLGSPGRPSRIGNAGCLQHRLVIELSQKYKKTPAQ
ncbi:oxidoreductase, partial [Aphelenchoides avenae]